MTPTRGTRRSGFPSSYEQRRRRLRHLASYASSTSSPLRVPVPLLRDPRSTDPSRDRNNNDVPDPDRRPYLIGAIIYKPPGGEDLRLHVFESHQVRVRHVESESSAVQRMANEYSVAAEGKSTFVSSIYLVQKYVPVRCSSECLFELKRNALWRFNQRYRVNLNFQRKYVPALRHEYDPIEGGSFSYRSTACLNVSGN